MQSDLVAASQSRRARLRLGSDRASRLTPPGLLLGSAWSRQRNVSPVRVSIARWPEPCQWPPENCNAMQPAMLPGDAARRVPVVRGRRGVRIKVVDGRTTLARGRGTRPRRRDA
jgi:hypothetical protein